MKRSNQKKDSSESILSLIKAHHEVVKETFECIKDEESSEEEKREELFVCIEALKIHAEVEQEVLYDCMDEVKTLHSNVLEAKEEHAIAEQLWNEIEDLNYTVEWNDEIQAKAKVLTDVVEHHMEEEEGEMFDAIRETFTEEELLALGLEYATRFVAKTESLVEGVEDEEDHLLAVLEERMEDDPARELVERSLLDEEAQADEEFADRAEQSA